MGVEKGKLMSVTIALAGKGGVGKTTTAGLLVRYLKEHNLTPVLAVDADSNSNLNEVLGLEEPATLGDAREEMKSVAAQNPGMTKDMLIEMRLNQALVEETGYDLLVMGRPEGAGCYCAANTLLSISLEKLITNYAYMVIDNEAGMEHMSRLVAKEVDHLLIVSDASRRSVMTAVRIRDLAKELSMQIGHAWLIINQAPGGKLHPTTQAVIDKAGLAVLVVIPADEELAEMDADGQPTSRDLPGDSPVVKAAFEAFDKLELK